MSSVATEDLDALGGRGGPDPDLGKQLVNRHGCVNVNPGCMSAGGREGVPGTQVNHLSCSSPSGQETYRFGVIQNACCQITKNTE